jgi:phosphoribosylaminoimidazole-succinocarboxamide synthase
MYQSLAVKPSYIGKVRDVFDLGDRLLLVSTDRISAFDVVFNETIPDKGKILNRVSLAWFEYFKDIPNQLIETDYKKFPEPFSKEPWLEGRSILVKKCERIDYECVVRGYLSGSAFKEYKETGKVAFQSYPEGLEESTQFPEPIFTPARKNDQGHDENISEQTMETEIGSELFQTLKTKSIYLYKKASELLKENGILLCDTKFEFGLWKGEVILIDELLTPDSSRYWEASTYKLGATPPSLDKQILRNYLQTLDWDKNPPPPPLPKEIQLEIKSKYETLETIVSKCISQKST